MSETPTIATDFLKNLWDEREAAQLRSAAARAAALPVEPARRRPAHHQLRRRQHQLEVRPARSADRRAGARDGGEGQRRRSAVDRHVRASPCCISTSSNSLIARYRGEAHEDEMVALLPAVRVRREPRRRVDRHAAARVPAVRPRRSPASRLGDRAGGERQRRSRSSRSSTQKYGRHDRLGAVAAARLRAGADAAQAPVEAQSRLRRHHPRRPRPVHLGRHAAASAT